MENAGKPLITLFIGNIISSMFEENDKNRFSHHNHHS